MKWEISEIMKFSFWMRKKIDCICNSLNSAWFIFFKESGYLVLFGFILCARSMKRKLNHQFFSISCEHRVQLTLPAYFYRCTILRMCVVNIYENLQFFPVQYAMDDVVFDRFLFRCLCLISSIFFSITYCCS